MKLPIASITPFTVQDYPDHTACILWFSGCNMACSYCHNPELVRGQMRPLPLTQVMEFLEARQGLLDGVVLSGGECTLSPDLPKLAARIKSMGYLLKVDTNGTNPDMLETLIAEGLVDFVALDLKAPPAKYSTITGLTDEEPIWRSLAMLCASDIRLEVRTTVHTDLLDEDDINALTAILERHGFQGCYAVQNYRHGMTLGNLPRPNRHLNESLLNSTPFRRLIRGTRPEA